MSTIVIQDNVVIPAWVGDLATFRRWAQSEAFPEHGWVSYLGGEIWVDLSMEQLFSHNQVKTRFAVVLAGLVDAQRLGYFFGDRALLSNPRANLSTEPDGIFVSYAAIETGRLTFLAGAESGFTELEGTPDMVLEVLSPTSVRKDTVKLRDLYWQAGIPEYWLVDAGRPTASLNILHWSADGYVAADPMEGWLQSAVFNRQFQLTQQTDPLGHPQYLLAVR